MNSPKKSLGQHWLDDVQTLRRIVESSDIQPQDVVLEIGPGPGKLTEHLVRQAKTVIAVELDKKLANRLPRIIRADNLKVVDTDILRFDLTKLPANYKVVANIPYYLTSNLLRNLSESPNPPDMMTLLVQKEVAERICAQAGQMSILALSVQLYYDCHLGQIVPAKLFKPPPKVDSRIVILRRRKVPLYTDLDSKDLFWMVKAGFSEKRKKLRSSLAGGLGITREETDQLLRKAGIDGSRRAQELSLDDWYKLVTTRFPLQ